jgi:pimeloyl-ACP methyl ester carboxylesterase
MARFRSWLKRGVLLLIVALIGTAGLRIARHDGNGPLRVITLPGGGRRWVDSLVPERMGALIASKLLAMPRQHGEALTEVLQGAYARMDADVGDVATPAIATYLGLQRPSAFDAVVIDTSRTRHPTSAVIFLHGFAGNFSIYCWQLSKAAAAIDALVVCPSIGPRGDWWNPNGLATVRATLGYVHRAGIGHVYLSGLSNGAVGAGVMARALGRSLDGVILISGAPHAEPPQMPLLVVQGSDDSMMPASLARRYARSAAAPHAYVELASGHYVFLSHWQRVTAEIGAWLASTHGK